MKIIIPLFELENFRYFCSNNTLKKLSLIKLLRKGGACKNIPRIIAEKAKLV